MPILDPKPDRMDDVLAVASECDPTQLELSAPEGFLLSRIDGATPWRLLREIGGIPAGDVDVCLDRWLEAGWLVRVGGSGARTASGSPGEASETTAASEAPVASSGAASEPPIDAAVAIDESALDHDLDLGLDVQRRILQYEASLDRPYHVLLGVEPGAEPKVVKRAYFKLSKEFHPDRYFRKEIGSYAERLDTHLQEGARGPRDPLRSRALRRSRNQAAPPVEECAAGVVDAETAETTRAGLETKPTDAASVPPASGAKAGRKPDEAAPARRSSSA